MLLEALAAGTPVLPREVGDDGAVTGKTFRADAEFVDHLCKLEELPLDDVEPFMWGRLTPRYRELFDRFGCA